MVSRRPPLKAIWERMTPSRAKAQRVATRWEAVCSGAHVSSIPASPNVVNPHLPSSRTALEATPRPREVGASQHPTTALTRSRSRGT